MRSRREKVYIKKDHNTGINVKPFSRLSPEVQSVLRALPMAYLVGSQVRTQIEYRKLGHSRGSQFADYDIVIGVPFPSNSDIAVVKGILFQRNPHIPHLFTNREHKIVSCHNRRVNQQSETMA